MFKQMSCCLMILAGLLLLLCACNASGGFSQGSASSSLSLVGQPTLTVAFINRVLADHGSPAQGLGPVFYDEGRANNIDPVFALAFFRHESDFGLRGEARSSLSIGNLRCLSAYACQDGYAYFSTWADGIHAWYHLISGPLYVGSGLTTLPQIVNRYAPSADGNSPSAYIQDVTQAVQSWRLGQDQ